MGNFFGAQNEASPNDPSAYVLAEVGAVIRKKREGETKREIETQSKLVMAKKGAQIKGPACLCLSLHFKVFAPVWVAHNWRKFGAKKKTPFHSF